jgi:hypothetical protein
MNLYFLWPKIELFKVTFVVFLGTLTLNQRKKSMCSHLEMSATF